MLMPPVWTIGLLGYQQGQQSAGETASWTQAVVPIAVFTLLTGGVYVHNQIVDMEGDRANNKLFLLADGFVSPRAAAVQTAVCYGGAVVSGFLYDGWLGFLMALSFLLGMGYNVAPFRWKDRPLAGLLYNVVVYGIIAFVVGWRAVAPFDAELLLAAVPYCFGVGAIYLNTTLPDMPGDRLTGKITIGVRYGFRTASVLACVLLAGGVATGFWRSDYFIAVASLACLPLFVWMTVTGAVADVARATKIGVLSLSMAASVVCPAYLMLLTALFFGAKPYYRYRFNIDYPTFKTR